MRAPLSWLRDFAPFPDDVGLLRDALDDLGLVVEAIEHVGEGLEDVVVGRVLEIRPIKGADKIRLTIVDGGAPEPLEIVCGATISRWGTGCRWRPSARSCRATSRSASASCAA